MTHWYAKSCHKQLLFCYRREYYAWLVWPKVIVQVWEFLGTPEICSITPSPTLKSRTRVTSIGLEPQGELWLRRALARDGRMGVARLLILFLEG